MMRGSLDRPKKKSAKENLDSLQTKKSRAGLDSSHSPARPNHGKEPAQQIDTNMVDTSPSVQQSDTNMGDISPSHVTSLNKGKSNASIGKLTPIRSNINTAKSKVNPLPTFAEERVQGSNTTMDGVALLDMLSLNKAKSNTSIRKFKPIRANINTAKSKVNPLPTFVKDRVQESNTTMDGMALPDMIRFLEEEEALLTQMQSKMSDELSRLQVEEHVFLHTLKILGQKHASSNKVSENQQQSSSGDRELIDALNEALTENGEPMPCNLDKDEEMSEE